MDINLVTFFDDMTEEDVIHEVFRYLKEDPVCDCGGEKCKLPHFTWCSAYKQEGK